MKLRYLFTAAAAVVMTTLAAFAAGQGADGQKDWRPGDLFEHPYVEFQSSVDTAQTVRAYLQSDRQGKLNLSLLPRSYTDENYKCAFSSKGKIQPPVGGKNLPSLTPVLCDAFYSDVDNELVYTVHVKENDHVYLAVTKRGQATLNYVAELSGAQYLQQLQNQALMIAERLKLYSTSGDVLGQLLSKSATVQSMHHIRSRYLQISQDLEANLNFQLLAQVTEDYYAYDKSNRRYFFERINTQEYMPFSWMLNQPLYAAQFAPMFSLDDKKISTFMVFSIRAQPEILDNIDYLLLKTYTRLDDFMVIMKNMAPYIPEQPDKWNPLEKTAMNHSFWPVSQDILPVLSLYHCEFNETCNSENILLINIVKQIEDNRSGALTKIKVKP